MSLTADDDTEQHTNDKIPYSHADDDTNDGDILRLARPVPGIPQSFLDEVDAEDEDQRADDDDRYG